MKVIIAGSRDISDRDLVEIGVNFSGFDITEVVSGGARGVDYLGEQWANEHGIPITKFRPNWKMGKLAGKFRNIEMAQYAHALIAVWDGMSPGTAHMIAYMMMINKPVYIVNATN